jgi:actin-related protein
MEFNIGNRVTIHTDRYDYGEISGTVIAIRKPLTFPYTVLLDNGAEKPFAEDELNFVSDKNYLIDLGDSNSLFEEVLDEMATLHRKKNHDYGDSFATLFKDFGLAYSVPRIYEKATRLKTLLKAKNEVNESIRDTLLDIASYAVMTIVELDNNNQPK